MPASAGLSCYIPATYNWIVDNWNTIVDIWHSFYVTDCGISCTVKRTITDICKWLLTILVKTIACRNLLLNTDSVTICSLMRSSCTLPFLATRYTSPVNAWRPASVFCGTGMRLVGCSWTPQRRNWSGLAPGHHCDAYRMLIALLRPQPTQAN